MIWGAIVNLLGGGLGDQIRRAYEAKLAATNDADRLRLEGDIAQMEAAQAAMQAANADRWSATSLGRYLVVVPFGLWWAGIYAVSIINGLFGTGFVIFAVPATIHDMALILVPAIIIADAGALTVRRWRR